MYVKKKFRFVHGNAAGEFGIVVGGYVLGGHGCWVSGVYWGTSYFKFNMSDPHTGG